MLRSQKAEVIEFIRDRFGKMTSAVFVDYAGLSVEEVTKLRDQLRDQGVEYRVLKNKLLLQALRTSSYIESLDRMVLRGMTGVAWSYEEPGAAARVLKQYRRENEKLKIKGAVLDGEVLDSSSVENQLATLPSKDEARSMLLATFNAPAQHMAMLLAAPAREFVGVLAAKQRQDEGT